jgi:phospholipid/cholesterol/gamma-HCH transport system ATP-binding protein
MIEIVGLKKAFGGKIITNNLSLKVNTGEFLTIIGRSGEGKSVLLKQIIGLIEPDGGDVIINGIQLSSLHGNDKQKIFKECGYVFQFAALLDSLTVFENVALYQLENGMRPAEALPLVVEKIKSVGLSTDVLKKYPDELSGGMKKRVGLARTLMMTPKILIYDEPTTGLDPITTRLIHELIKETHVKFNTTTIVISHDVEIFKYASHVAMLHEGKIIYKGEASAIWDCEHPHIHQFIRGLAEGPISHGI